MAILFRIHLSDNGYNAAVSQAIANLPSELAVTMPAGGDNLGQVTLDDTGSVHINSVNPAVVNQLLPLMQYNTVTVDSKSILDMPVNVYTPSALAASFNSLNFPGATVVRDI